MEILYNDAKGILMFTQVSLDLWGSRVGQNLNRIRDPVLIFVIPVKYAKSKIILLPSKLLTGRKIPNDIHVIYCELEK